MQISLCVTLKKYFNFLFIVFETEKTSNVLLQ